MKSQRRTKQWCGVVLVLALALALAVSPTQAQNEEFRYRYVSLDAIELPPGIIFFLPLAITNSGRIYGQAFDEEFGYIAVYAQGVLTLIQYPQPADFGAVNEEGTVGGDVFDPASFTAQAALFRGDKVELIPRLPGEIISFVVALNDSGMALVDSLDASFKETFFLYQNGKVTPVDFGPNITAPFPTGINNQGIISGIGFINTGNFRGFRFDYRTGVTTLLDPLPTEPDSWGLNINNRGDVLGYSFIFGATERIGVWDGKGDFITYFVEGTPEFPTLSSNLRFNDNNLIVITFATDGNSYLVPRPGVRLNLADLVENLPSGGTLRDIFDMNNIGNMIGFGDQGLFLLERIGLGAPTQTPVPEYGGDHHREVMEKVKKARELRKSWHPWLNEGPQK